MNFGNNGCINAIVTKYGNEGNVYIMAMMRPRRADADGGELQMTSGCIFFSKDRVFNNHTIKAKSSTPVKLTTGTENVDEFGALRGKALAYARAAIYEKAWHGENYLGVLDTWGFDLVAAGIVDDASNTSQAWVETSYVVHRINGDDKESLELFENSCVNEARKNVGDGVWRCIDTDSW